MVTGLHRVRHRAGIAGLVLAVSACVSLSAAAGDDLTAARAALDDGLFAVADAQVVRYLTRHADRPREAVKALQMLCRVRTEQARHADVLAALAEYPAVVAASADRGAFAFWRASALLGVGRAADALAAAQSVDLERETTAYGEGLRRVAARSLMAMGDLPAALVLLARVDQESTAPVVRAANLLEWAQALDRAGQHEAALELLGRQGGLGVTNAAVADGIVLKARLLWKLARGPEAEALLQSLAGAPWADATRRADAWVELAELIAAEPARSNDVAWAVAAATTLAAGRSTAWQVDLRCGAILIRQPATLEAGAALLQPAIRGNPGRPEAAGAQLALAAAYATAGMFERSEAEYRIFLETFNAPGSVAEALQGRAWALLRLGRFGEAATLFQKAADATSNAVLHAEYRFKAADAWHADGRYAMAAQRYRELAASDATSPLAPRALFLAGDATERAGDESEAEALYLLVVTRHPELPIAAEGLLRVAALREQRNAVDAAVDAYTRAFEGSTNAAVRGRALLGRGRAQCRVFRFETASADFARAIAEFPMVAEEAAYLAVLALYGLGRDEEADRACRDFLAHYPDSTLRADATLWLAKYQHNRGAFAEAQHLFLTYAELWPRDTWADAALLWAGRAAFRRADYAGAVEALARLAREHPDSSRLAEGRFVQADALGELARFDEAILLLDEIVTRFPDSDWVTAAWGRKGDCLFSLGADNPTRYDAALEAYRMVLRLPDVSVELSLQAEFKIGRCLEKLQRTEAAIEQYYTGVVIRFLRERTEGVWHNEAAQAWFAKAAFQAADLLAAQGDTEQATRVLQRVLQADVPGKEEARARLARLQSEFRWPL